MNARPSRPWAGAAVVSAATVLAYAPSFLVPFQFDDYARIFDNPGLRRGELGPALGWLGTTRLLPALTIVANYRVGGDAVFGYHLVNLGLHLAAALAVFALARVACRAPRLCGSTAAAAPLTVATVAALVMACHPLQTQAVTYIIQRAAVMAALGYVGAVACYLRGRLSPPRGAGGRPGAWFAATAGLGIAALLSKENAASLPLALLLAELVLVGGRPGRRALAAGAALSVVVLLVALAWRIAAWRPTGPVPASPLTYAWAAILAQGTEPSAATPLTYLLTQCTVVPSYLRLALLPWGLNVDHDVPLATGLTSPVLAGLALLAALLAAGVVAARRAPLVGFAILWIFVALSVESSVLPISDAMMEHRVYLAMPGLGLLAGAGVAALAARAPRLALGVTTAMVAALVALTFARNLVWQSPVSLWLDAADKSPRKGRVLVNLGVAWHGAGQLDAAARAYCRALARDPTLTLAAENLALVLDQQGAPESVTVESYCNALPDDR